MTPRLPASMLTTLRILAAFFGAATVIWLSYLILEVCGARDTMPDLLRTGNTAHVASIDNSLAAMIYSGGYFVTYLAAVMVAPVLVLTGIFFAVAMSYAQKMLQK